MINQKKLSFVRCECGQDISVRALTRHLRAQRKPHSKEFVDNCTDLISRQRVSGLAWKISDGINGKGGKNWIIKVLNGEIRVEELTFEFPRGRGQMTPEGAKKISKERMGKGNPSLANKPKYDLEKIKDFAMKTFDSLLEDPQKFNKLNAALDEKFPDYRYGFAGMFPQHRGPRGHNRGNMILSFLINREIGWIVSEKALDRGYFISMAQLKSPNLIKMANAGRKTLRGHTSIPHETLLNMVKSLDKNAKKEKQIDYKYTWRSYDIFSPSKNILIEMHGRVWHDLDKCKEKMTPLVKENVENDKIKEKLAKDNDYQFGVFWDDECDSWESKLEEIYGKRPKSYKQALREELDKKAKRRSL